MIDTTCDNAFTLHYARTNFKINFQVVQIVSETDPALKYQAPGAFGETGDDRKYTFLMYSQPRNIEISNLKLPEEGTAFDVKQFQDDNGLEDPQAGVGMVVKLGGQSSCDGTPSNGEEQQSSSVAEPTSTSAAASTTTAEPTSTTAPASTTTEQASSTARQETSTSSRSRSSVALVTPLVPSATTDVSEAPESTRAQQSQTADEESSQATTAPAPEQTTDLTVASSVVNNGTAAPSTLATTGSSSTTGEPAQQTTSDASGLSLGTVSCAVLVSVVAFAGLLI
jgi:hypothetical protein